MEKYLSDCMESILSQTFTDFECILVNDCSQDNSPQICDDYAKKDNRIKVIHKIKNEGSSLARKAGLEVSKGSYIQFVDSDDWIENIMIEKMYEKAVFDNFDMVICGYYYHKKNGTSTSHKQYVYDLRKESIIKDILANRLKTYLPNKLVRKELFLKINFPKYSRSEDYVITINNVYNANKIGIIDLPLYHYRYNEQSLSNNSERFVLGCIEENKNWCLVVDFLKNKYGGG